MTSKFHRQPGARARATGTAGSSGTPDSGASNSRHFWSSAKFPWIIMAALMIAILIAGGIYVWMTRIQPAIPQLLELITHGVPL